MWLGSEPPARLLAAIGHLRELAPDWEVRLWRDGDLDWLTNRSRYDATATYAGRSDIARYEILERFGGLYVDADVDFVRSPSALDLGSSGLAVSPERTGYYCNAVLASSPGHPFLRRLVERLGPSIDQHPGAASQMKTGPNFLTRELVSWSTETGEEWTEIPRDAVYPYNFDKVGRAGGPWSPKVVAVHRWGQATAGRAWVSRRTGPLRFLRLPVEWSVIRSSALLEARTRIRALRARLRPLLWRPNGYALGGGRAFTVLRSGRPIVFDADDAHQLGHLRGTGRYDVGFARFLGATLSGSDTYVDVGAGIGLSVVEAMWRLSNYGRVFAFERDPRLAAILRENVRLHRDSGAPAEVVVHEDGAGELRLDDVLDGLSHLRLLRVDVDGHEPHVLAGALGLIESGRVDLVDLSVVRRRLGPRLDGLRDLLVAWESAGAGFSRLDHAGRAVPFGRPITAVLSDSDHGHLVVDVRAFGVRARRDTRPA